MTYVINITPIAFDDLQAGVRYYQFQKKGLGERFSVIVEQLFTRLSNSPFSASIAYDDIRYKKVDKFPYVILYKVEDNLIVILRIFNTHQQPTLLR